jgi:hypothetical protein
MKIRLNEDYYFWCCDWCDSENLVLWAKLQDGTYCGACHRPMALPRTRLSALAKWSSLPLRGGFDELDLQIGKLRQLRDSYQECLSARDKVASGKSQSRLLSE